MLSNNPTDQVLVQNYLSGNQSSFEILLNRHKDRVYAFIMSKIKNRDITEDIFQDTFIKVINSLQKGNYNEQGKFLPWMMRIAHNLVIDHFRKQSKMRMVRSTDEYDIFNLLDSNSATIEQEMIITQVKTDLKLLIEQLPEEQKEVLNMRYFEEMSFKEIAELTGVSINTALGRMRYALINIRKSAEKHSIDLHLK